MTIPWFARLHRLEKIDVIYERIGVSKKTMEYLDDYTLEELFEKGIPLAELRVRLESDRVCRELREDNGDFEYRKGQELNKKMFGLFRRWCRAKGLREETGLKKPGAATLRYNGYRIGHFTLIVTKPPLQEAYPGAPWKRQIWWETLLVARTQDMIEFLTNELGAES